MRFTKRNKVLTGQPKWYLLLILSGAVLFWCCTGHIPSEKNPPLQELTARISSAIGDVQSLSDADTIWKPVRVGMPLENGVIIKTAPESRLALDIDRFGRLDIAENTLFSLSLETMPSGSYVSAANVKKGSIIANLHKLVHTEKRFYVRTPTAVASIRGTSFEVSVSEEQGESEVLVMRGAVSVHRRLYKIRKNKTMVPDSVKEDLAVQKVVLDSVTMVSQVMRELSYDWEYETEKKAQKKVARIKKQWVKKVKRKKLSRTEMEMEMRKVENKIDKTVEKIVGRKVARLVEKGKKIDVDKEKQLRVQPYTHKDFQRLKTLFTENIVRRAYKPVLLSAPGDSLDDSVVVSDSINFPPYFGSPPKLRAVMGVNYVYEVMGLDDDDDDIRYRLVSSPPGMHIDSLTGLIGWEPDSAGARHWIEIKLQDEQGNTAIQGFELLVVKGVEALLSVDKKIVLVNEDVRFDAGGKKNNGKSKRVRYRWNVDQDSLWDIPEEGYARKASIVCSFDTADTYMVAVEAINGDGRIDTAMQMVIVEAPPKAELTVFPASVLPGNVIIFDARKTRDNTDSLLFRYDFDNDGIWDLPDTGFTNRAVVKKQFFRCYSGCAVLEVKDAFGLTDTASHSYKIGYPLRAKIDSIRSVNLVTPTQFRGTVSEGGAQIIEYGWDVDGDSVLDYRSDTNEVIHHLYGEPGTYTVHFFIKTADSTCVCATAYAVVYNESPLAYAGENIVTIPGRAVTFYGSGTDPDGEILRYEWDFDGDSRYDYSSETADSITFVYENKGFYRATLRVMAKDGYMAKSSIDVDVVSPLTSLAHKVTGIKIYEFPTRGLKIVSQRDAPGFLK